MAGFDDLVQRLMAEVEANPALPIEDVMKLVARDCGLSEEDVREMEESFSALDSINDKAKDLESARKEGMTRQGWLKRELSEISESAGSKGEEILTEIEKATEICLDNALTQEL